MGRTLPSVDNLEPGSCQCKVHSSELGMQPIGLTDSNEELCGCLKCSHIHFIALYCAASSQGIGSVEERIEALYGYYIIP